MSYVTPAGAYYTFTNGQRMSGLGGCGCSGMGGCGCSGLGCGCAGLRGFGDIQFNGDTAWSLWTQCSAVWQASQQVGPTCKEAADIIRAGLMQLGYGSLPRGIPWGSADQGAWRSFTSQHGLPSGGGLPTKGGLQLMDELLQQGKTPGPEKPIEMTKVGDEYVESKTVESRAGIGTYVLLGLVGLGIAGGAYYYYGKKKKGR